MQPAPTSAPQRFATQLFGSASQSASALLLMLDSADAAVAEKEEGEPQASVIMN